MPNDHERRRQRCISATRTWTGRIGGGGDRRAWPCSTAAGCSSERARPRRRRRRRAPTHRPPPTTYHGPRRSSSPGHGEVTGTPDTMTMSIGVSTTDAERAGRARRRTASEANALQDTLTAEGRRRRRTCRRATCRSSQNYDKDGNITGYRVSNMVTVTLHDLAKAGDVIDAGAARSATTSRSTACSCRSTTRARCCATPAQNAVKKAIAHAAATRGRGGREARRRPQDRRHRHRRSAAAHVRPGASRPTAPRPRRRSRPARSSSRSTWRSRSR